MEVKSEKKGYSVNPSDYQLLEEVGQGVSALVYRALCIPCNEIVAIKSLDLERCNSNLDDIRREAQTMSLINHPNVVKAYCSFVVEHSLWVVMPYMAGGSCLHIMKAAYPDGFEEPIIATFLKESLKALEYLHYHGHIHRDVKAGNILVDASGAVKLGDFGVSACMFDTGDRQRSRNTFVGTPCWMAPEVLEQVHGYDFKADIWSFGITALELAHGHAPFSKYPPMKVLLMTLQNAPPGLDYERDKRFSKSFKEMIAMCLVKDPAKRPTAEKLLKHSFFKQARSADYIARTILGHLAPLWERVKELKKKDATRLAQKKMPYGEQEERSQNEYKRGVSCWNFDVEDLKAQAALDDAYPIAGKEEPDTLKPSGLKDNDIAVEIPQSQASALLANVTHDLDPYQMPVTIHSLKAETATDAGERVTRVRSGPLPTPVSSKASNNSKSASLLTGKKEPKHIGRFDVFEDDPDLDNSEWRCSSKNIQQHKIEEKDPVQEEKKGQSKVDRDNGTGDEKEHKGEKELKWSEDRVREQEECRRTLSGPLLAERVVGSSRSLDDEREQDRDSRSSTSRSLEDLVRPTQQPKERAYSGPLTSSGVPLDNRPANGHKEASDEKLKGPVVQKKGRFSVTHDVDLVEGASSASSTRKNASVQTSLLHKSASVGDWLSEKKGPSPAPTSQPLPASSMVSAGLNASALISQLQNLFTQTTVQQDLIVNLMAHINPSENSNVQRSSNPCSKNASRSTSMSLVDSVVEVSTERERELLSQVADLQCRIAILVDELQAVKLRNVQLERQLNAFYNKEEEERIRREEAAREDG